MFDSYLSKWHLDSDGEPIVTRAARLLPVLRHGEPAMLKLSFETDERLGGAVMEWWDGDGAARVLARDEELRARPEGCRRTPVGENKCQKPGSPCRSQWRSRSRRFSFLRKASAVHRRPSPAIRPLRQVRWAGAPRRSNLGPGPVVHPVAWAARHHPSLARAATRKATDTPMGQATCFGLGTSKPAYSWPTCPGISSI
ncbi:hypothetical protein I6F35_00120 [Bradyrhizobium sp. BRP22]|nr:hypothetical protein [Bradyrhizobium sp. BRP22]